MLSSPVGASAFLSIPTLLSESLLSWLPVSLELVVEVSNPSTTFPGCGPGMLMRSHTPPSVGLLATLRLMLEATEAFLPQLSTHCSQTGLAEPNVVPRDW